MNKDQLLGNMKIIVGKLVCNLGDLTDDKARVNHARCLMEAGKVQRTMGEARKLIEHSLRQRTSA